MHNMSAPEADGLQQQKTTPGAAPVSLEQETESTIRKSSPRLDNRRLKNVAWSDESWFLSLSFSVSN